MAAWMAPAASAASSIMSFASARKASKEAKKNQAVALSNAGQAYSPINLMGPGGQGVNFGGGTFGASAINYNPYASFQPTGGVYGGYGGVPSNVYGGYQGSGLMIGPYGGRMQSGSFGAPPISAGGTGFFQQNPQVGILPTQDTGGGGFFNAGPTGYNPVAPYGQYSTQQQNYTTTGTISERQFRSMNPYERARLAPGTKIEGTPYFVGPNGTQITSAGLESPEGTRGRVIRSNIGDAQISVGNLDPLRSQMIGIASQLGVNLGQLDPITGERLQRLDEASRIFGQAGLGQLGYQQQLAGTGLGLSATQLADSTDFANQLRLQAQGAYGALPETQRQASADALSLLRELAAPQEERDFARLQQNLFNTGRMGTSGGGLQTEAFARGLAQADTQRQLAAMEEGRAAQQAQLGLGSGLASQQDALMANAMGRFGNMLGINQALGQDRFARTSDLANLNYQRAGDLLSSSPEFLRQQLIQQQLGNLGGALTGVMNIDKNALAYANYASNLMTQQANAGLGQTSLLNQIAMQPPDMTQAQMWGQAANMFGAMGGGQGLIGALTGLFGGGGGNPSPQGGIINNVGGSYGYQPGQFNYGIAGIPFPGGGG